MKNRTVTTFLLMIITVATIMAQNSAKVNRDQLKTLHYLAGTWKGEALIQQRGAPPMRILQEEKIEWRLDSLLLTIEGIGKEPSSLKQVFHAFGIIAYDQQTKLLRMKSFTHEGKQTEAYFNVLQENNFEWGFDLPDGKAKVRYTISLSPQVKTWREKGEYSPDGVNWFPTIELNLVKQN